MRCERISRNKKVFMRNFVLGKKVVEFSAVTGEVLSSDKFSETQVYSRGGGPLPGGGSSGVSVHSNVTTKQEFWLRTDDGEEKAIQLSGADIPIRLGQRLTVINAHLAGSELRLYAALINHTAKTQSILQTGRSFIDFFKVTGTPGMSVIYAAVMWAVIGGVLTLSGNGNAAGVLASVVAFFYLAYRIVRRVSRDKHAIRSFVTHLEGIVKSSS